MANKRKCIWEWAIYDIFSSIATWWFIWNDYPIPSFRHIHILPHIYNSHHMCTHNIYIYIYRTPSSHSRWICSRRSWFIWFRTKIATYFQLCSVCASLFGSPSLPFFLLCCSALPHPLYISRHSWHLFWGCVAPSSFVDFGLLLVRQFASPVWLIGISEPNMGI